MIRLFPIVTFEKTNISWLMSLYTSNNMCTLNNKNFEKNSKN